MNAAVAGSIDVGLEFSQGRTRFRPDEPVDIAQGIAEKAQRVLKLLDLRFAQLRERERLGDRRQGYEFRGALLRADVCSGVARALRSPGGVMLCFAIAISAQAPAMNDGSIISGGVSPANRPNDQLPSPWGGVSA
jgi:hypothetical protein